MKSIGKKQQQAKVATPSGSSHLSENVSKSRVFHRVGLGDFPTEFQEDSEGKSHWVGGLFAIASEWRDDCIAENNRCYSPTACRGWGYCRERNWKERP